MDAFPNCNPCQRIAVQISGIGFVKHFTRVIKESARLIVHICCRNRHEENFSTFGLKMGQTPIF